MTVAIDIPVDFLPLDDSKLVYKKIITPGLGEMPTRASTTVKVHYTGSLFEDGTVFDSSLERKQPIEFKIQTGQVIKGWDIGIATMQVGEHAELLILPEYGYGKTGSPPKIPSNATLLFKVELVSMDVSTAEMTIPEKIDLANVSKDKGNDLFKAQDFKGAMEAYTSALGSLHATFGALPEDGKIIQDLKITVNSNLAAVCLKLNECTSAVKYSKAVLEIDSKHPKALYRLFQGLRGLCQFDEAIKVLQDNRDIQGVDIENEIKRVKQMKHAKLQEEKKMYAKMFA
jgi:peptidylprolyl isomerase